MGRGHRTDTATAPTLLRAGAGRAPAPVPAGPSVEETLDELTGRIKQISVEEFNAFVRADGKEPNYGADVLGSVQRQRPGATRIAGKRAWKSRGRKVREGAEPIMIGAGKRIYGDAVHPRTGTVVDNPRVAKMLGLTRPVLGYERQQEVFDVADTEPIGPSTRTPEEIAAARRLTADLVRACEQAGVPVFLGGVRDPQSSAEAEINRSLLEQRGAHGALHKFTDARADQQGWTHCISTPAGLDEVDEALTLAHELGHFRMGHLDRPAILRRMENDEYELEAEGFAYALGRQYGIDYERSALYMRGYAHNKQYLLERTMKSAAEHAQQFLGAAGR